MLMAVPEVALEVMFTAFPAELPNSIAFPVVLFAFPSMVIEPKPDVMFEPPQT